MKHCIMDLFYAEEHRNCYNYSSPQMSVFKSFSVDATNETGFENIDRSVLVFILSGKICVTCGSFHERIIETGHFVLFPKNTCIYGRALEKSEIISCAFIHNIKFCNKYSLENLANEVLNETEYDFYQLPIRKRLHDFLVLLSDCLNDGLGCSHFHNWKVQELFVLLRAYYSKEELAQFFYPILGQDIDFKDFILTNYTTIFDITEFAQKANMTPATFNRRFKNAFHQPAYKWLTARKAERVLRDIKISSMSFDEIATQHGFSSAAYLATFCKQHFEKSPSELRGESLLNCTNFKENE